MPEEYLVGFFLEITSGMFPYATLLGSTVDTRWRQSMRLLEEFLALPVSAI